MGLSTACVLQSSCSQAEETGIRRSSGPGLIPFRGNVCTWTGILTCDLGIAFHYASPPSLTLVMLIFQCDIPCPAQVPATPPPTCPQPTQVLIKEGPGKRGPITKPCLQAVCKLSIPLYILCTEAPVVLYQFA